MTQEFSLSLPTQSPVNLIHFSKQTKTALKKTFKFENVEVYEDGEAVVKGAMGHPVLMPLVFETAYWIIPGRININGRIVADDKNDSTDKMFFPIAIIDVSRSKNVDMTPVEGRDGTIKEYGSHGDYMVSIKGLLMKMNDNVPVLDAAYPVEERNSLLKIEQAKAAVPVANELLNSLGINKLVIKEIKWVPMEGVENMQAFELSCVSDEPEEYKLDNNV